MKSFIEQWKKEEKRSFEGWDFSHLENRWEMAELPWDYEEIVKQHLDDSYKLLDMGTGGGEILLGFHHPYERTCVTEGYLPNYHLCQERLAPLGITVKFVEENDLLPYPDKTFDLIINRHESFRLDEVWRTLKSGGLFITQQVGCENNRQLSEYLLEQPLKVNTENQLSYQAKSAKKLGFQLLQQQEELSELKFFDIGALVYYASIIKWEFPDFSVEKCTDKLLTLQQELEKESYIRTIEHRYLLVLKKE